MDDVLSEENIKHLIFRELPEEIKFPLYRSMYSEQVRKDKKKVQDCHRTMGFPPDFPSKPPSEYLKKGAREMFKPDIEKIKYTFPPKDKVPRHDEWTKPLVKPQQNYINFNALQVIRAGPKQGSRKVWDSSKGYEIHSCVSEPKFVYHKGYAKVPKYIKELKLKQEKKFQEEQAKKAVVTGIQPISAEERESMIQNLKKLWEMKQNQFQLLPVISDTPPQIKKKSNLERELMDLEKRIDTLERHQIIYIFDQNECECTSAE